MTTGRAIGCVAQIQWHADDAAAISLESRGSSNDRRKSELLLFCLYAAHWINDLNRSHRGSGINLGVDLALWLRWAEDDQSFADVLPRLLEKLPDGGVKLVRFADPVTRGVLTHVHFDGTWQADRVVFGVTPGGFGWRNKGLLRFAETSVLALQRDLFRSAVSEPHFREALLWAGHHLGRDAFVNGVRPKLSAIEAAEAGWLRSTTMS
jgi:hypothetical protein